jgi:hypothetical protein
MIDLNKDLIYAKKLSEVGDEINKISKEFSNVNFEEENIYKLKDRYENYLKAIKDYKKCKKSLSKVVPPSKVFIEHEKIVDAIQLFIEGTGIMFNSIKIDSVDKEIMNKGISIQELGVKTVVKLSDEISIKLVK